MRALALALSALTMALGATEARGAVSMPTDPVPVVLEAYSVSGTASWYCYPGRSICTRGYSWAGYYAAAGPSLRAMLGKNWRGKYVRVCASRCVTVRLIDWCACPRGRVIDLYGKAFRVLAPLSAGVVGVRVTRG